MQCACRRAAAAVALESFELSPFKGPICHSFSLKNYYRLFLPADGMHYVDVVLSYESSTWKEREKKGVFITFLIHIIISGWKMPKGYGNSAWLGLENTMNILPFHQVEKRESILLMICEWKRMDLRLPWGITEAHQVLALWWLFCTDRNSNRPTGN